MNTLISVIIPVYNRKAVLPECIRSLQGQTCQDFEVVLIDDGSTDGTLELCRELAQQDSRVRLLEGAHGGVSAARNRGLEAAAGAYIFFLDSDDVIHPRLLEDLRTAMETTGAAMAGTGVLSLPEEHWSRVETLIAADSDPAATVHLDHERTLRAFFRSVTPINLIGGVMMRRELIDQTRFRTDLTIGEDYYFVYRNLIKEADAVFLKQSRYYSRLHADNSSNDFSYRGFWSRFYRRELVWQREEDAGRKENADLQKLDAYHVFLRCIRKNGAQSPVSGEIRRTVKKYRKLLLPALPFGGKVYFLLALYAPSLYMLTHRIKHTTK